METPNKSINPEQIIDIVIRRRWLLIVPFIAAMIAGIYLALTLPKTYQSQTLILVEPQRVPSDFVRSVVTSDIDERISTISQQIMSRTNLEKIIKEFNLFSEPGTKDMYTEDKIANLRNRINVNVTRSRREGTEAFAISFKGIDPEKVMRITNTLASYFIDTNLKVREAQAIGTSDFLQAELDSMKNRLSDMEESLKNFRTEHMGALPEQLDSNLRVLERLQDDLNNHQIRLREAKQLQTSLERQISEERAAVAGQASPLSPSPGTAEQTPQMRLQHLQQQLADLQTRYTDRHPDIIRLKKQIEDLEGSLAQSAEIDTEASQSQTIEERAPARPASAALVSLERQLSEVQEEIRLLEFESSAIAEKIEEYQNRVEQTPKIEQELLSIQRDYENIQNSYESLLGRKLEAELSVNMEKKQKGEQFHILDPAQVPTKPQEPDMRKLLLFSIAAGLGIGGGLIFLLEYMDRSYRSPEEIESSLGIKVLATVPVVETWTGKWLKRFNWALTAVALVAALGLLAGFGSISLLGEEQTMEYVKTVIGA